jgi:YD repeat-containing protein
LTLSRHNLIRWFSSLLLALTLATVAHAQAPITFQYFYDELGQLTKVVDSTGNVIEYVYDSVGNILEIKRSTVSGLAIFNFTPQQGPVGTTVTIQGQGFSATPSENVIRFNGTPAAVTSATTTTLVVTVPLGATTGPIAVTVGEVTATSATNFTVTQNPVITSIFPKGAFPGTTVSNFQVTGLNLTGSTFSFVPEFVPPAITVTSTAIDPTGTSVMLGLSISADAVGSFVLVATNAQGSSDAIPSANNTLSILNADPAADNDGDGLSNADEIGRGTDPLKPDTDGDGFPDGLEVALGADPLIVASVPTFPPRPIEAIGAVFSTLNTINPGQDQLVPPGEAIGPVFSVLNSTNLDQPLQTEP